MTRSDSWRRVLAAALLAVLVAVALWMFNRGYGETSQRGYKYASALFTACNLQDRAKLLKISQMINQDREQGKLEVNETQWLLKICQNGISGNWSSASAAVRRLMEDQQRAAALPDI